jgi:hypothetical protein
MQTSVSKKRHLAKSIFDVGWGMFLVSLAVKPEGAVKRSHAAYLTDTSQVCSRYSVIEAKGLSVCCSLSPEYGASLLRGHNAVRAVLRPQQAQRGKVGWAADFGRQRRGIAHMWPEKSAGISRRSVRICNTSLDLPMY